MISQHGSTPSSRRLWKRRPRPPSSPELGAEPKAAGLGRGEAGALASGRLGQQRGAPLAGPALRGLHQPGPDALVAIVAEDRDVDLRGEHVTNHPRLAVGMPELDLDHADHLSGDVGDEDLAVGASLDALAV